MHYKKPKKSRAWIAVVLVLLLAVAGGVALFFVLNGRAEIPASSGGSVSATSSQSAGAPAAVPAAAQNPGGYTAMPLPEEMRAMWIAYPDWQETDIANEATMRSSVATIFDNCTSMGLNTVIVMVHPFSDAFYQSDLFPWSHIITGTQGASPGYDPLAVMVEEAHARNLRIEAWFNPYRIRYASNNPPALAENSPAAVHPDWTREVEGNLWFNPGLPEVRQLIIDSAAEVVSRYEIDGLHFDDYFYPSLSGDEANTAFDGGSFAQYGNGLPLADWRRQNVNEMVKGVYAAVKAANPTVNFGISMAGNNEYNYGTMYADSKEWMANAGYVDYVMPQLYWGFNYVGSNGNTAPAFANKTAEWAGYARIPEVKLYCGLNAHNVDEGDGGANDQSEWNTGHSLADLITYLRSVDGFSGFALFRYGSLYHFNDTKPHAAAEVAALTELLNA